MDSGRWVQIEELFHRVVECDPNRRAALLDEACNGDSELRREVEALLSYEASAHDRVQAAIRTEIADFNFSLQAGEIVSHYRILGGLRGGGMGLVYQAEDVKLGRRVALKFLPEESVKDREALARFEREARAASAPEHPNICPIYEFGEHQGQPFLVMQLLEGKTLRELLGDGRTRAQESDSQKRSATKTALPLDRVLDIATQIADGLNAAHQKGIIHRDVKPANIFVTAEGQAKILDFGLAKLASGAMNALDSAEGNSQSAEERLPEDSHSVTPDPYLSRTGVAMGTAGYMSPEQARGEKLDPRTDIFSFGLVLYEVGTGRRAFEGDTGHVLHAAILGQTPIPARQLNPELPAKFENIINRAIEKDRGKRYQTAAEMHADLVNLQRQLAPKHLPRAWAVGLAAAAVLVAGTILFILNRPPKTVSVAPDIRLRQLTTNSSENPVFGGAISPDGKYLAYSDMTGMHLNVIATGETHTVPQPEELKNRSAKWGVVGWFPDSTRFVAGAYLSTEEWDELTSATASIWAVSVLGGMPTKLRDHALGCAVSPDGFTISFAANRGKLGEREVWLMGPNGEQARKIYDAKDGTGTDCWIWSPDGKHYLYVSRDETGDTGWSQNVQGGPPVAVIGSSELRRSNDIVFLHDRRVIYSLKESESSGACNYWITRFDLVTGKRTQQPKRLTNWPSFCVFGGSVTRDDRHLVFASSSSFYTSYVGDLEEGETRIRGLKHFTFEDSDDITRGWSSDSRAVIVSQGRADRYGLFSQFLDAASTEQIAPLTPGGSLGTGTMSPDGEWYIGQIWPVGVNPHHPSVPLPIVRFPISGGPSTTVLTTSRPAVVSCGRLPSKTCVIAEKSDDEKQMVVSSFDPINGRGIELARFDLGQDLDLFPDLMVCVISPDGDRLAILRSPTSPVEIYTLHGNLLSKIPPHSLAKLISLAWSADQRGLFLTRKAEGGGTELLYGDLKGNTKQLRKCNSGNSCFSLPSPDGRHLAIVDRTQNTNMWMMENF